MAGSFEKTNPDWQIRQLQQQFGEWLERLFAGSSDAQPNNFQPPEWLLRGLFWLLVLGLAAFLGWWLYRRFRPLVAASWSRRQTHPVPQAEQRSVTDWLQQSRTAQQQSNYREACRALYMATLQQLNDRHLIDQAVSRTDGEYLRLLPTLDRPQPYQVLIQTHERLCFSQATISAEQFDRCWQAFQQLSQEPTS
ncbi:DUF4129 domain-containing protein [Phormidium tenue FACHB-886]|nr:DUF4129 domain-containing protein [Phormidium tenue FACHB-886]